MQISNGVFIVTGAASGLGAATARMIVDAGGHTVLADVNADLGNTEARSLGANAHFVATDVCDEASAKACISAAVSKFGALTGLINCAGIAPAGRVFSKKGPHDLAMFQRAININLVGTFNMIRLAAEAISTQTADDNGERGVIVNTASIAAFDGMIGQAAYAASKAGVVGMTLPLARDLAKFSIRVMTIAPGVFDTQMLQSFPDDVRDDLTATVPFPQRAGDPAEFATLVQHIITNRYLNGSVIRLDGALRMGAS